MKTIFTVVPAIVGLAINAYSQTIFIPAGSAGIGTSTTTGVGIGINNPDNALQVAGDIKMASRFHFGTANAYGGNYGIIGMMTGIPGKSFVFYNYDGPVNELMTLNGSTGSVAINNGGLTVGGNAGFGTTTPAAKLEIKQIGNGWNDGLRISRDASNYLTLTEDATDIRLKNWGSGGIILYTSAAEGLRVLNNGNVGIGTPSPISKLDVSINSATTNYSGGITSGDLGLFLKTTNATNNNLNILSFGDAGGYGVAHIGTIYKDHTSHQGKLFFATKGSGPITQRMIIDEAGLVGIGTLTPYSASRLHIKSPTASPWGFLVEANGNDKIVGVGHDGTNGFISTSYLGSGGYSGLELRTQNITRVNIGVDGNVGIGTTSAPLAKLQIANGDLLLQNATTGYPSLWLKNVSGTNTLKLDYNSIIGAGSNLIVRSGSSSALVLNDVGGNVGIGTANPTQKLTVNGTIYGKEVKVDASVPGPDYVFEKDYRLPSLEEIKKYIDQNKHLPEVPSAKEMEANGINVGEMNMILLKKIEELTLYVIEQQKQLNTQQKEIQDLKDQKK